LEALFLVVLRFVAIYHNSIHRIFSKKTPPQNGVESNCLVKARLHNQANQSAVVENHASLFESTIVTNPLLPNGELIVRH